MLSSSDSLICLQRLTKYVGKIQNNVMKIVWCLAALGVIIILVLIHSACKTLGQSYINMINISRGTWQPQQYKWDMACCNLKQMFSGVRFLGWSQGHPLLTRDQLVTMAFRRPDSCLSNRDQIIRHAETSCDGNRPVAMVTEKRQSPYNRDQTVAMVTETRRSR